MTATIETSFLYIWFKNCNVYVDIFTDLCLSNTPCHFSIQLQALIQDNDYKFTSCKVKVECSRVKLHKLRLAYL